MQSAKSAQGLTTTRIKSYGRIVDSYMMLNSQRCQKRLLVTSHIIPKIHSTFLWVAYHAFPASHDAGHWNSRHHTRAIGQDDLFQLSLPRNSTTVFLRKEKEIKGIDPFYAVLWRPFRWKETKKWLTWPSAMTYSSRNWTTFWCKCLNQCCCWLRKGYQSVARVYVIYSPRALPEGNTRGE